MSRTRRAEQLRAIASHLLTAPILLGGDAEELLSVLRAGASIAGIPVTEHATAARPAHVVVVAVKKDARRSSLVRAAQLLRDIEEHLTPDAVRIIVVQSVRSRLAPPRLQRLVASEVLFQVALALPHVVPGEKTRTLRQRFGLATLDAAGFRVLRFG